MNKSEFVKEVSKMIGKSQAETERIVSVVFSVIADNVKKGEKVSFSSFGTFERKDVNARVGRNPQTGQPIDIPAKKRIVFKPSQKLKIHIDS